MNVLADAYVVEWLDMNESSTVSKHDVMAMPQNERKDKPANANPQEPRHNKRAPAKHRGKHPPKQSKPGKGRSGGKSGGNNDNWGAVRHVPEINKWQARTPEGTK